MHNGRMICGSEWAVCKRAGDSGGLWVVGATRTRVLVDDD